jgi:hypothetical protein
MIVMNVRQLRISRRSVTIAAALVGVVSLAIGANAALNKRSPDTARAVVTEQSGEVPNQASRLALVIGNGHYPDANAPLAQPINDARALTAQLRRTGFDVDVVEDASRDDMQRAIARLKSKIRPDTVVLLFFGGYGVQVGRESYMIPVDAAIWKEADVRRQGVSVESVLDAMKEQGARAKLVVIDASRGKVADDSIGANSVLVSELLTNLNAQAAGIETAFNKTRIAISRASDGEQVPSVSSSLLEDVSFATAEKAGS